MSTAAVAQKIEVGGKTAAEITKEVTQSGEEKMLVISGTSFSRLETVVRYLNRDKISAKGEGWYRRNFDNLCTDSVETLITAREKAIVSYQDKKELQDKDSSFRDLLARGEDFESSYKQVYGEAAYNAYTVAQADKKARK